MGIARRAKGSDGSALYLALLVVVSFHVTVKVPRLRETQVTDLATVRLFPAVCSQVGSEIGSLGKSFSTHVTTVRLFTGVGSHVCL